MNLMMPEQAIRESSPMMVTPDSLLDLRFLLPGYGIWNGVKSVQAP